MPHRCRCPFCACLFLLCSWVLACAEQGRLLPTAAFPPQLPEQEQAALRHSAAAAAVKADGELQQKKHGDEHASLTQGGTRSHAPPPPPQQPSAAPSLRTQAPSIQLSRQPLQPRQWQTGSNAEASSSAISAAPLPAQQGAAGAVFPSRIAARLHHAEPQQQHPGGELCELAVVSGGFCQPPVVLPPSTRCLAGSPS